MTRYIFKDKHDTVTGAATNHWAKVGDVVIKDHGNGLHITLGSRKKPLKLEYHELGDLLRAVRILEREMSLSGQRLFDKEELYEEAIEHGL